MSLDPPTYLASLQSNIRHRPIPWDGAVRAGTLTEEHYAKIRAVDKAKKPEQRKEIVDGDVEGYRLLFVGGSGKPSVLESAAQHANVIQYILVLLSDLLDGKFLLSFHVKSCVVPASSSPDQGHSSFSCLDLPAHCRVLDYACPNYHPLLDVPSLAKALYQNPDPYRHFLPLLSFNNTEDPIPLLTSHALTTLMATARDESQATFNALPTILKYLSGLAKSTDGGLQDIAVQEYSSLLFGRVSRDQFWEQRSDTLAPLVKILQTAAGIGNGGDSSASLWSGNVSSRSEGTIGGGVGLQLLYHVLLVLWQLSFESESIGDELDELVHLSA